MVIGTVMKKKKKRVKLKRVWFESSVSIVRVSFFRVTFLVFEYLSTTSSHLFFFVCLHFSFLQPKGETNSVLVAIYQICALWVAKCDFIIYNHLNGDQRCIILKPFTYINLYSFTVVSWKTLNCWQGASKHTTTVVGLHVSLEVEAQLELDFMSSQDPLSELGHIWRSGTCANYWAHSRAFVRLGKAPAGW